MALPFITILADQNYDNEGGIYTLSEVRHYDVSSLDLYHENAVEEVMIELPARRSFHPSIPDLWLVNRSVASSGDTERMIIATLVYKTPSVSYSMPPGVQNSNNETWEWQMVAQQTTITSVAEGNVLTWDSFRKQEGASAVWTKEPDPNTFIRANRETGEVAGAEVYRGTGALRVTKYYADKTDVNATLRKKWYAMQATVNNASWIDWTAGEVLYLGATISYGIEDATVQHQFLFGETLSSVKFQIAPDSGIAETLTPVTVNDVQPWYYIWQTSMPRAKAFSGSDPQTVELCPRDLKIAKVYTESDFDDLGLVGPETGGS